MAGLVCHHLINRHVPVFQVWISFAQFELSVNPALENADEKSNLTKTRAVYREANQKLKDCSEKEERLMLLESWKDFEVGLNLKAQFECMMSYCIMLLTL